VGFETGIMRHFLSTKCQRVEDLYLMGVLEMGDDSA
jgi:hypothetical protein